MNKGVTKIKGLKEKEGQPKEVENMLSKRLNLCLLLSSAILIIIPSMDLNLPYLSTSQHNETPLACLSGETALIKLEYRCTSNFEHGNYKGIQRHLCNLHLSVKKAAALFLNNQNIRLTMPLFTLVYHGSHRLLLAPPTFKGFKRQFSLKQLQ